MAIGPESDIALWVVTPKGLELAKKLQAGMPRAVLFRPVRVPDAVTGDNTRTFTRLVEAVAEQFHRFGGHIFIMATGIVVRSIAPHLHAKTVDPAVVVVDELGRYAISLLSGHIGGANHLASLAARVLDAAAVITTATDIHGKPAIDLLAQETGLGIENPGTIKEVNMALLTGLPVRVYDPWGWLLPRFPAAVPLLESGLESIDFSASAAVWVDDRIRSLDPRILVLRPPSLVAGIGCNRNTQEREVREFLYHVLDRFQLCGGSLSCLASIDIKSNEAGLLALAAEMELPLEFFTKEELSRVEDAPTPSALVKKHVGVNSVCEAAAILASRKGHPKGRLIVPKQISRNVTVAIARRVSTLSESVPETRRTFPGGPGTY